MSKDLFTGINAGIQMRYSGTIQDWLVKNVRLPHSARSTQFDPTLAPWLNDPLAAFADDRVKQICLIAPTGGAKTTFLELVVPWVVAQQPGPMLLVGQNDDMSKEWAESRLLPILASCEPVKKLFPEDRHQKRKTTILFPHMPLFISGANMSSLQEKSMRYCYGDEVWQWKNGMIGEMKKRHHDRWNRKTILVSQGYDEGCELQEEFESCEQFHYGTECSTCGQWHKMLWSSIKYTDAKLANGDWDLGELTKGIYHECPHCGYRTPNTSTARREMLTRASYRSEKNSHVPGYIAFTWTALSVWWINWADMVLEWVKANDLKKTGIFESLKQFKQKRLAQMWVAENSAPEVALSADDYFKADYIDGQPIVGELERFLTIDRQSRHYWVAIRAWCADGSSKLLWEGKVLTVETIRDLQLRMKVKDKRVAMDGQYETPQSYEECSRYGWIAFHGSGSKNFIHEPRNQRHRAVSKLFSKIKEAAAPNGKRVQFAHWANEGVKDQLVRLRSMGAPTWSHPQDVSRDWLWQINSEVKKDIIKPTTKQIVQEYVKFRTDNHLWDCEAMQVVFALMLNLIHDITSEAGRPDDE
jgi:hypothetical protein